MKEKIKELKTKIIEGHNNENITSKSLKIAKDRVTKKGSRYILLPEETVIKNTHLYIAIVSAEVEPVDDKLFYFKVPSQIVDKYKTVKNPKTHEINWIIPHKELVEVNQGFDQSKALAKGEEPKAEEVVEVKKKKLATKKVEVKEEVKANVESDEKYVERVSKDEGITIQEKMTEQMFEDIPYSDMTLRDYAAITLNKPVSNKAWLNEIIKSK